MHGMRGMGMGAGGHHGPHVSPAERKKAFRSFEIKKLLALLRFTKGHKMLYVIMFVFLLLQLASYQGLSFSLKYLINDIFPLKRVDYLLYFLGGWVVVFALHSVFTVVGAKQKIVIVRTLIAKIRALIIKKLQVLSIKYFDDKGTGKTSTKILIDMERLQQFFMWLFNPFLTAILMILMTIPFLTALTPILTVLTFVYLPCVILVQRAFRNKILEKSYHLRNTRERLSERIVEFISGIKHIRTFANEDLQTEEIVGEINEVKDADISYSFTMRILQMIIQFFFDFSPILLWVAAGILMIHDNALSLGDVVAYIAIVRMLTRSFSMLFHSFDQIVTASPSVTAILGIIENEEVEDDTGREKDFSIDGSVRFEDVTFSYETRQEQEQLKEITLAIKKGEKVAIVGESGAGKSTFVDVLLGLYPIKEGAILFGEQDIKTLSLRELRSQMAIMTQETFLFNTSLYENIRIANLDANKDDVREACRKAEILSFIDSLPDGFETLAGERGVQLSGGQRQRIGLARVFLRNPSLIILDEPSSSLDVMTEQRFIKTLYKHVEEKTLIIIAHRLSTIKNVNRILVFDEGRLVEDGTFETLRKKRKGVFARMLKEHSFQEDTETTG